MESQGLSWHSENGREYWNESACYEFSAEEIDTLEEAAAELNALYFQAAEAIVRNGWWEDAGILPEQVPLVRKSWEEREFSLYGRFDVILQPDGRPKLLEYNADTPTSLLEASVIQWFWLQDVKPGMDQFNSLHERLIDAWKRSGLKSAHFTAMEESAEDMMTVLYLQDTAHQAGLETALLPLERVGWNAARRCFTDEEEREIRACFKLYPWEWMLRDEFAAHIPESGCRFIEPAWKLLFSNKGILTILWELFPDHPLLLPAFREPGPLGGNYVGKPVHGREGANVAIFKNGLPLTQTGGPYGEGPRVYQALAETAPLDGRYPVLGLWIVDGEPAGMGVREDDSPVTGNLSRFTPHWFAPAEE